MSTASQSPEPILTQAERDFDDAVRQVLQEYETIIGALQARIAELEAELFGRNSIN